MSETKTYKIIIIGDANCGKTTFINRHKTGQFNNRYIPTVNAEVTSLSFSTSHGNVVFNVWDCAGSEKYKGLDDSYYVGAHAVIMFFDLTERNSYNNLYNLYKKAKRVVEDVPFVICGSKADLHRTISNKDIKFPTRYNIPYYDISSKNNYNHEKPFLSIIRQLFVNH
jgi:GTP-binding nuclear protein Ran